MGGGQAVPWAQGPVGNQDHTEATVVIIGAGISGMLLPLASVPFHAHANRYMQVYARQLTLSSEITARIS